MTSITCPNCGIRLDTPGRFCPECGVRLAGADDVTVEAIPPDEPEEGAREPRYFGAPPRVPGFESIARVSTRALTGLRARAGYAAGAVGTYSSAQLELFRLRREFAELAARRAEAARSLGEAVYGGADEDAANATNLLSQLDAAMAAKEAEMTRVATDATARMQRARFEAQPTAVVEPPNIPEPMPVPSEPPQPVTVPEPTPVPSEPPAPVPAPDPTPEPAPPMPEPPASEGS